MSPFEKAFLVWVAGCSAIAFALFGLDKALAGREGQRRVSEFHLVLIAALGGWLGGLLAMVLFRHKTAKLSFQLKFAVAFLVFAGLVYAVFSRR
jgi:uncharacterized membrane protein YsdA (DUF1294 family)